MAIVLSGDVDEPFDVVADEGRRFVRLTTFARSGSAELTAMLLGELRKRWLDAAGLCEEDLSVEQRQDLSFVFGGLLAMLAEYEPIDGAEMLSGFAFRPLGRGVVDTMRLLAGTAQ